MGRAKELIEKITIAENDFFTAGLLPLSNSLQALSELLKAMGADTLSKKVEKASDDIHALVKLNKVEKDKAYKVFKDIGFNKLLDEIKLTFKNFEGRGIQLKYGRKGVSLPDAIKNFTQVFQTAIKDLRSQGFDTNNVK